MTSRIPLRRSEPGRPARDRARPTRLRALRWLLVAAIAALALPAAASAAPSLTFDVKVDASQLKAASTVDLPVYLVENRNVAAGDTSLFADMSLAGVHADFESLQSTFLAFDPVPGFETTRNVTVTDSIVVFNLFSDSGIPVAVDNSGIMGRTEILIGTLRVRLGPSAVVDGRRILFEMTIDASPTDGQANAIGRFPGGGNMALGGIAKKTIRIDVDDSVADPPAPPGGEPPAGEPEGDGDDACEKATKALRRAQREATNAKRRVAKAAKRAKRATGRKRAAALKAATRAKAQRKRAQKRVKQAKRARKRACG